MTFMRGAHTDIFTYWYPHKVPTKQANPAATG